jgi:hypothetical protein
MAITVLQTPGTNPSLHDDLWFVASSNNTGQANFKYVFDIYISSTIVARIKLFPDPVEDSVAFNAANIVRNYWLSYFKPSTTQTAFNYDGNDIYVAFTIKYGEEYDGTLYTNLTTANYKAYNYYNPLFRDWSADYFGAFDGKFLTNRDKNNLYVGYTEKLFISYLNIGFPDVAIRLKVSVDGGTVQNGSTQLVDEFTMFDVSPAAINTYFGSTIIPSTFTKYTVRVNDGETITVYNSCSKYTVETLHFLNQLGGYDTYTFRLVNKQESTAERKNYDRPGWEFSSDTMSRYDANKRIYAGVRTFSVNQSVVFRLTSDWLTETDHNWLRELIMSPEVYLEKSGYFYPVTIGTNNWSQKIRNVDKTFNLTLDVNYSKKVNSQYR